MSRNGAPFPLRVGCVALALLAAVPPALGDDQTPADPAAATPATRAEDLIRQGVDLRNEGRERDALERFREAYAIHPSPRALAQMGLAAKSLRLYVEAERSLVAAMSATNDPWIAESREALDLALAVVSRQLASLVVRSNVVGAELLVDGTAVAKLPLAAPVRVPAGAARIEVRALGHSPSMVDATLPAERTTEVTLDLVRQTVRVSPSPAMPWTSTEAPPTRTSLRPWAYVAGGVGVVGVGVGTIFGVMALSEKQARDDLCPNGSCATEEGVQHDEDGREYATVATIAFAAGAVGLGAAVVLWLLEPTARKSAAAGVWSF